jgi:cobalt/nickel transport system permease protein
MTLLYWENLSPGGTPLHRLPARLKLWLALGLVVAISLMPLRHEWFFIGAALGLGGVVWVGRISLKALFKRVLLFEPLVLGTAMLAWFQPNGLEVFLTILVKSTLSLLTLLALSGTTPFGEWLQALKAMRVPALLVTLLALMYRYLFVLLAELERMRRARACRTYTAGRTLAWKNTAVLIGQLFIRTTERADRIYAAMCARGWK